MGGMARDKYRHIDIYKKIGRNIKKQRKTLGISQEELAFRLHSARNYVGCVERGEKLPSLSFLLDTAEVLGCDIKFLFDFE
jgi:transcriptional regulator with XRE-family HTH domain